MAGRDLSLPLAEKLSGKPPGRVWSEILFMISRSWQVACNSLWRLCLGGREITSHLFSISYGLRSAERVALNSTHYWLTRYGGSSAFRGTTVTASLLEQALLSRIRHRDSGLRTVASEGWLEPGGSTERAVAREVRKWWQIAALRGSLLSKRRIEWDALPHFRPVQRELPGFCLP